MPFFNKQGLKSLSAHNLLCVECLNTARLLNSRDTQIVKMSLFWVVLAFQVFCTYTLRLQCSSKARLPPILAKVLMVSRFPFVWHLTDLDYSTIANSSKQNFNNFLIDSYQMYSNVLFTLWDLCTIIRGLCDLDP